MTEPVRRVKLTCLSVGCGVVKHGIHPREATREWVRHCTTTHPGGTTPPDNDREGER